MDALDQDLHLIDLRIKILGIVIVQHRCILFALASATFFMFVT